MGESDVIVCFEFPCNSQQSGPHNRQQGDPFIVPVFLCDPVRRSTYGSSASTLFGYPFFVVITEEQATDEGAMYDAVVERLQRWTANVRDLFSWELGPPTLDGQETKDLFGNWQGSSSHSSMEEVKIPLNGPSVQSITEFKENGEVITVEESIPEEGDIVDEKGVVIQDADEQTMDIHNDAPPHKVGFKKDIFNFCVHAGHAKFGVGYGMYGTGPRPDVWEKRRGKAVPGTNPILLEDNDAFYCEFDENMKAYYFGDHTNHYENARWNYWEEFVHPEFEASQAATAARKNKNITLQDCLEEFTKEEKLGQDDLWYCPRCKKHQQATKRFDLWKVPDILVVHLKRFSNSRTLRDKIDTFVDFPLEGLDLTAKVGEHRVAKKLAAEGVDISELGLHETDDGLIYDLYAVDEHLGGLGGGHYRAYAENHTTRDWYHFDDSYVSHARPQQAVVRIYVFLLLHHLLTFTQNSNAYLLFYKRRSSRPLGGKTHEKIELFRNRAKEVPSIDEPGAEETQLPTPPSEGSKPIGSNKLTRFTGDQGSSQWGWGSSSNARSSPGSTPPPLSEVEPDELPSFDASLDDEVVESSLTPIHLSSYSFPDHRQRGSPTSSNEAEPDLEENTLPEDDSLDDSGEFYQESVSVFSKAVGPELPKLLSVEDHGPSNSIEVSGDSSMLWGGETTYTNNGP